MARSTATTTTAPQAVTVEHIDPRTLLVDKNIRTDARLNADFIASLKEHGVLSAIVAVRTTDGEIRVRMGHRRTLGAIEADLATVPVIVAADEGETKADQVERLVQQHAENEHRTGLTTVERADTVAQLALLGVSAAQITKRTRMPREQVDAALVVTKSDLARAATEHYDFLDLTQAAVVAEFDDQPETVKALVAAAKIGQFEHMAQRARDARTERQEREAAAQTFRDAGLTIIERPDGNPPVLRLHNLTDDTETRAALTVEEHVSCPGHAAWLSSEWIAAPKEQAEEIDPAPSEEVTEQDDDEPYYDDEDDDGYVQVWNPVYVCTQPERHTPRFGVGRATVPSESGSAEQEEAWQAEAKEKARQERREVIENNKAWRSAETVRREWLTTFLTRKTPPKGTGAFLTAALGSDASILADSQRRTLGFSLLGLDQPTYGRDNLAPVLATASEGRAQVLALGLALGAYEANTDTNCWRHKQANVERYLRFLGSVGYPLSEVERRACGEDPLPETENA